MHGAWSVRCEVGGVKHVKHNGGRECSQGFFMKPRECSQSAACRSVFAIEAKYNVPTMQREVYSIKRKA